MASPIYKNKLQKYEKMSTFIRHRAQLNLIAKNNQRYPLIDYSYRQIVSDNNKGQYFKGERTKQIDLQNNILLSKILKIKAQKNLPTYWLIDRSHSLNQAVKKSELKSIDFENKRLLKNILCQKPHISTQKLNKSSIEQQRLSASISKIQKYRYMQIQSPQGKLPTLRSFQSFSSKKYKIQHIKLDLDFKNKSQESQNQI